MEKGLTPWHGGKGPTRSQGCPPGTAGVPTTPITLFFLTKPMGCESAASRPRSLAEGRGRLGWVFCQLLPGGK